MSSKQLEETKDNDNNAEQFLSNNEPEDLLLEQTKQNSQIGRESVIKNGSSMMVSRIRSLSNKERLLLRKQALNMKKCPLFAVGDFCYLNFANFMRTVRQFHLNWCPSIGLLT